MIDATQQIQVDITYHYPPELLELLCDAVPALFRSKPGVLDFFEEQVCPISTWWTGNSSCGGQGQRKKHEIARSVLCRLNDDGEPALTVRREVLKRVSQFEDFSSCWETTATRRKGW